MRAGNVIIDASFAGAWVLTDESLDFAESLLQKIERSEVAAAVPELWFYEMTNLIMVAGRGKRIAQESGGEFGLVADAVKGGGRFSPYLRRMAELVISKAT